MAKRSATTELNHDNWDDEEEVEEVEEGFKAAPPSVLEKRKIRVAKRRAPARSPGSDEGKKQSIFAGFGFMAKPNNTSTKPSFSFCDKIAASTDSKTEVKSSETNGSSTSLTTPAVSKETQYHNKLRDLNLSVTKWIKEHVDKNPLCILTPIFKDYEKYLSEITVERDKTESVVDKSEQKPAFQVNFTMPNSTPKNPVIANMFSSKPSESSNKDDSSSTPIKFSFGSNSGTSLPSSSLFSFKSQDPVFPKVSSSEATPQATEAEEDNEDEPPPQEPVKLVTEDDALFTHRVKVFVKKDDQFSDRGVGTLYIKNVSGKHQALVRADTTLGNILFNIVLNESVPTKRMGKNNVMLICRPVPEADPKPVPVLLRVKTEQDADNLLKVLDDYKKQSN